VSFGIRDPEHLYGFGLQNGENRYICIKQKEIAYE
jgi:hypothetical protein